MKTVNDELEFNTIEEVMKFNTKERAFRNGWKEIHTIVEQYLADIQQKHLDVLKDVNANMKNDLTSISDPECQSKFYKLCKLVNMMKGISIMNYFICTPVYKEIDIKLFETEQEAYEKGKRKAYDAMLDIWIRSCNEKIIEDEQKQLMLGALNLLKRISELTGYKFDCNDRGIDYESIRANISNERIRGC